MQKDILMVKDVKKIIKGKTIIKDINFNTKEGEIIGLLGANGAGKTTIMKCITGLVKMSSGVNRHAFSVRN